jgi:hypothetical protein
LADPAIKAKADATGLYPVTTTPAEFAAFIRKEAGAGYCQYLRLHNEADGPVGVALGTFPAGGQPTSSARDCATPEAIRGRSLS